MAGGRNYIEQDMQATTVRNLYDILCIGATKRYIYIHRHRERDIYIFHCITYIWILPLKAATRTNTKSSHPTSFAELRFPVAIPHPAVETGCRDGATWANPRRVHWFHRRGIDGPLGIQHARPGKHTKNYGKSPLLVGKYQLFLWAIYFREL
jgi:hypothetical protein